MVNHQQIAEAVLGTTIAPGGYCPCPGAHLHTTKSGPRDFRIIFDPQGHKMPSGHCFHASCAPARHEAMCAIIRAIRAAERAEQGGTPHTATRPAYKPHPQALQQQQPARPTFNAEHAAAFAAGSPLTTPTREWLRSISPTAIPANPHQWAELLLDTLYHHRERILIFDTFKTQGTHLRVVGEGNYRLSPIPGHPATPCQHLPLSAADGAWYLTAPVLGTWQPNPNNIGADGLPRPGRRHAACCTRFPYAVLESDTLPEDQWLRILARLPFPISAVYTSGGKSLHALIKTACATAPQFNAARKILLQHCTPLGADPAAITPVRLSRLPGCIRRSKGPHALQELLYLNPLATPRTPLHTMPRLR